MKRKKDPDYDPDLRDDSALYDLPKNLRHAFLEIRTAVENSEPDIARVLQAKILKEDKMELFQLYEIYASLESDISLEKLELRKRINTFYEKALVRYTHYNKYTKEEHENFEREIEKLEEYNSFHEMKYDILKLETSMQNKRVIYNEYRRMSKMNVTDDELPKLRQWLTWAISIPHDKITRIPYEKNNLSVFLKQVSDRLDEELYGMHKVKKEILLFLNSRILNPDMKKCSMGLIGMPGTGKTYLVKVLSGVLNCQMEQISLGGVMNPEFLKGHQYTYIGAEPGEICKCLRRMGSKNGILFFDEYDKVSENKDVCSALLHITDSVQNDKFQDNYLAEITIDLSYLWLFYSMNKRPTDDALSDRIFYVEMEGYSQLDKFYIVKDYLLKRAHKNLNWELNSFSIEDQGITHLVNKISPPEIQGIRALEHAVFGIANKVNFLLHHKSSDFATIFNVSKKIKFPFCMKRSQVDSFLK